MAFDSRLLNGVGVLSAVVQAGSFKRAADALGMSQSGVSRTVSRLEARVGVRIFARNARSIALTDEGRRLYEAVSPHLVAIEDAAIAAAGNKAVARGRLRVNVDGAVGRYLLTPRIAPLLDANPELSVEILVRDRLGDLVADGFDAAIRFGEPEPRTLGWRRITETRVLTCASPAYVERCGRPMHPRDLVGHECVLLRDPATGRPFEWEFIRGGEVVPVAVAGRLTVGDTGGLLGACLGGQGIAQTLEIYCREYVEAGRLLELFADWAGETFPLYAIFPLPRSSSLGLTTFLDFVDDLFAGGVAAASTNTDCPR